MKYELTKQQLNNLIAFLSRTNLSGSESAAFNEIVNIFSRPAEEVKKEVKNDNKK